MFVSLSTLSDSDLLLSPPPNKSSTTTQQQDVENNGTTFRYNLPVGPYKPTVPSSASAYQQSLSSSSSSTSSSNEGGSGLVLLPYDFIPGSYDVICGRGKAVSEHAGNRRFRDIIESRLEEYKSAVCKLDKSLIVSSIIDTVTTESPHGGFIKQINGRWYQVDNHFAREKCGQSFRDLLHSTYKSSTKSKAGRRKQGKGSTSPVNAQVELVSSYPNLTESRTMIPDTHQTLAKLLITQPPMTKTTPAVSTHATATAPVKEPIDDSLLERKRRSFDRTIHKLMKGSIIASPNRSSSHTHTSNTSTM